MRITIKNWSDFQHYKTRRPPWIKLYRTLLDNQDWNSLDDLSARLLIELWLLASEADNTGVIRMDSTMLAWRLRYESKRIAKIDESLQVLHRTGFIVIDSDMLAPCQQHATPETETETETETERETDSCPESQEDSKPKSGILIPLTPKDGDYDVPLDMIHEWQTCFPSVDIKQTLMEMRAWCIANPLRRKTKRGVLKFITGWLNREQCKG